MSRNRNIASKTRHLAEERSPPDTIKLVSARWRVFEAMFRFALEKIQLFSKMIVGTYRNNESSDYNKADPHACNYFFATQKVVIGDVRYFFADFIRRVDQCALRFLR